MFERALAETKANHRQMCEHLSGKMCCMHGYYRKCKENMKVDFKIEGVPYQWLCSEPMHHRDAKGITSVDPEFRNLWFCSEHCLYLQKHGTDDMKYLHTRNNS